VSQHIIATTCIESVRFPWDWHNRWATKIGSKV